MYANHLEVKELLEKEDFKQLFCNTRDQLENIYNFIQTDDEDGGQVAADNGEGMGANLLVPKTGKNKEARKSALESALDEAGEDEAEVTKLIKYLHSFHILTSVLVTQKTLRTSIRNFTRFAMKKWKTENGRSDLAWNA